MSVEWINSLSFPLLTDISVLLVRNLAVKRAKWVMIGLWVRIVKQNLSTPKIVFHAIRQTLHITVREKVSGQTTNPKGNLTTLRIWLMTYKGNTNLNIQYSLGLDSLFIYKTVWIYSAVINNNPWFHRAIVIDYYSPREWVLFLIRVDP